jgi:acyl dehydratase
MPLNPAAVGAVGDVRTMSWNSKDALLYAVGIGAGQNDLPFTTENTKDVQQVVFPTFAVVAGSGTTSPGKSAMAEIGTFNWALLVHGSQAITLHRPIPVEAEATVQDKVVAMYDKGKAAVVVTEAETKLKTGELLWTTRSSVFIRGEGGWDGDRGPSGPQNEPPAKAPDHEVTLQTSPDQAFVYRLSGDRNPLHPILRVRPSVDLIDRFYTVCARMDSPVVPCLEHCATTMSPSSSTSKDDFRHQ